MPLLLSGLDLMVSAGFTVIVASQWLSRRKVHSLLWAWALLVWTFAVAAETAAAWHGAWTPTTYRAYYAFGALMVAAWLGSGSLHLAAAPRLARRFTWTIATLSLVGGLLILTYPIDPALLGSVDSLGFVNVKVFPFLPVRIFVVIANVLGSAAFIGAALVSLWNFAPSWVPRKVALVIGIVVPQSAGRRHDVPRSRVGGVWLIALGGLIAAAAHSVGALGGPGWFRISELAAIVLIFSGYLLSTRRTTAPAAAPASA